MFSSGVVKEEDVALAVLLSVLLAVGGGGNCVEEASFLSSSLTSVLPGMVLKPKGLFTMMRWLST